MRHSLTSNARGLSKPVVYGSAAHGRRNGLAQPSGSENFMADFTDSKLIIGGVAVVGGLLLWTFFSGGGSGKRNLPDRA